MTTENLAIGILGPHNLVHCIRLIQTSYPVPHFFCTPLLPNLPRASIANIPPPPSGPLSTSSSSCHRDSTPPTPRHTPRMITSPSTMQAHQSSSSGISLPKHRPHSRPKLPPMCIFRRQDRLAMVGAKMTIPRAY